MLDNTDVIGTHLNLVSKSRSERGFISVIFCVRNEKFRLPYFLDYYRNLGVTEFYAVDNDSSDGCLEYLTEQEDVNLFHTVQPYKASNAGRDWTSYLANKYCLDRWCLTLDVDEFFVYPLVESFDMNFLVQYLDQKKYDGVFSIFLDFYNKDKVSKANYIEGNSPFEVCNYFDSPKAYTCYEVATFPHMEVKGGARQRIFWKKAGRRGGPSMRKIPLVKWKEGFSYLHSTHSCTPIRLADITAALAHFKFFSHIKEFSKNEVSRNARVANSIDWKVYAKALENNDVVLYDEELSCLYEGSKSLANCSLISASVSFYDFMERSTTNGHRKKIAFQKMKEREQDRDLNYSEYMAAWKPFSYLSEGLDGDQIDRQNLIRIEEELSNAANSSLWKMTYRMRKFASKFGLTDQRSLTEENYENQDVFAKFTFIYRSIWWDLLGPFRVVIKILKRMGLLK